MKKALVCILAIVFCISLLAACGGTNVSGKYISEDGDAYDFNGHGEVTVTIGRESTEGYTYAVKDAEVYVYEPDYDHESSGETNNILTVSGETLTDKDGTVFTKAK